MTTRLFLPPATEIVATMEQALSGEARTDRAEWVTAVAKLVHSNLRQWDLEDVTRDPGASDAVVAEAKREIDRLNAGRHRLVEEIDAAVSSTLPPLAGAPLATESPGMVMDRLSVLVIRRTRTKAASLHDDAYAARVPVLELQVAALGVALDCYMAELRAGTKRFLPYQHLKLYGATALADE
jgi:hypothetical protein